MQTTPTPSLGCDPPELERVEVTTGLGGPNVWHVYRPGCAFVEVHAAWDGHHVVEVHAPEVAARVLIYVDAF